MWPFHKTKVAAPGESEPDVDNVLEFKSQARFGSQDAGILAAILSLFEYAGAVAESANQLLKPILPLAFRQMAARGEAVFLISPDGLHPATEAVVLGNHAPDSWIYQLTLQGPSQASTIQVTAAEVLHFRRGCTASQPWRGRSPLLDAGITARTLAALENRVADVSRTKVVTIVSMYTLSEKLRLTYQRFLGAGRVLAITNPQGSNSAPGMVSIGPKLDPTTAEALRNLDSKIAAAYGVSPLIVGLDRGDGAARREAYRQLLHGPLSAFARIIETEAAAKLGRKTQVDLSGIFAADIAGRARAYRSLTDAGMPGADAARICGFQADD